jgi:chromosome segregation ATPase
MAIATGKTRCITCGKDKATFKCGGCSQGFCYNHLTDHKQELSKQLDEVEVSRDIFRQTLTEQTAKPQKYTLIEQIDKWERDSIDKVRQNAEETRQLVLKHTTGHIVQLETRLHQLTGQLRQSREENDFFETDLRRWNKELSQLTEELANLSHINLRQNFTALVTKISVDVTSGKPLNHSELT